MTIAPTEIFSLVYQQFHKSCYWSYTLFLEDDMFVCQASTLDPIARITDFFPVENQSVVNAPPAHVWEIFQVEDEQAMKYFDEWANTVKPEWDDEPFLGERVLAYTCVSLTGETLFLFRRMPEETGHWVIRMAKRVLILTTSCTGQCDRLLLRVIREVIYRLRENRGAIALHAAALQWQEYGLLLAGPHGVGKTTLLLHLLEWQETSYIGNDHVFVSLEASMKGSPLIQGGLPLVIRCSPETLVAKQRLQPLLSGVFAEGKHEVTPRALVQTLACRFKQEVQLHAILFPVFSPRACHLDITMLSPEQARELLLQEVYTPTDERWRRPWIISRLQKEEILYDQARELINRLVQVLPILRVQFGPIWQEYAEQEHPLHGWLSQIC